MTFIILITTECGAEEMKTRIFVPVVTDYEQLRPLVALQQYLCNSQ